jgi:hypothetical protein
MPEEPPTSDLVALTRQMTEAKDVQSTTRFYGPNSIYDLSNLGLGVTIYLDPDEARAAAERLAEGRG